MKWLSDVFYSLGILAFGGGMGIGSLNILKLDIESWATFDLALYLMLVGIGLMLINQTHK